MVGGDAAYVIWGLLSDRFTVQDADAVGSVLALLCLGLSGWAAQTVISRGFYALGSTWLPTIVGTVVAFCTIPLYIILRREWGAIGLAIASAIAILIYVAVLGWLQRRRFSREAAIRGDRLDRVGGFLSASLRMASATGVAIAGGLAIRSLLPHVNMDFLIVLMRSLILCATGLGIYVFVARQLGVREFAEVEGMLVRRLKLLGLNRTKLQR